MVENCTTEQVPVKCIHREPFIVPFDPILKLKQLERKSNKLIKFDIYLYDHCLLMAIIGSCNIVWEMKIASQNYPLMKISIDNCALEWECQKGENLAKQGYLKCHI